jgi:ribosomal protein S18 acetylase RimI-like enzyme
MFEAMGGDTSGPEWRDACIAYFQRGLGAGQLAGVVVDAESGALAACGVIEFVDRIPSPRNPTGRWAYISTISTDPEHRRQGLATAVMEGLLHLAHARQLHVVELHATDEGRPLYERLGFRPRDGAWEMALRIVYPPP